MPAKFKAFVLSHPISVLCAVGAIVFGVHLTTVAYYPSGWYDEIEILEIGRASIFNRFPEWSVVLSPANDGVLHPLAPMFHYLAGFVQESLYRLTGSFVPSRIFFLLSLPVAALSLFGWLRTKDIPVSAALPTALFLLFDPNATICAHWYRPDLWTTTLAFTAMTLLSGTRGDQTWRRSAACLVAGILTATMLFLWITSILLLPLIGWEALQSDRSAPLRTILRDARLFLLGAVLSSAVFLIPLYPHIPAIIAQYAQHSELGGSSFDTPGKRLLDFIKIAVRSPYVWLLAMLGIVTCRRFLVHVILFSGLCALMLSTRVYHLRMVQLMPFLFLFTALALSSIRRMRPFLIGSGLICYFGLSVLAINYAAIPAENTYKALTDRLRETVPGHVQKVYLYDMEHELYHSGRALGWQMYSYGARNLLFDPTQTANLIDKVDAVIITSSANPQPTDDEFGILSRHGFRKTGEVRLQRTPSNRIKSALENLFYAHGYPDCDIYTRTAK